VLTVAVLRELYEVKNREQQLVGGGLRKVSWILFLGLILFGLFDQGGPVTVPQNGRRNVEEIASRIGSKFSLLSRNVSQNVQKMSDKIGSELKGKASQISISRPESSIGNVEYINVSIDHVLFM